MDIITLSKVSVATRQVARRRNGHRACPIRTSPYVTGAMGARWNNSELNPAFGSLTADDFEIIQLGWR